MEYRRIGQSGLSVSEISYGNRNTHNATEACVRAALDAGVTMFHTAAAWGHGDAEEALATALHPANRDDIVLCTGTFWPERPGAVHSGLNRKHLMSSLHGSLRRLRTDHIDIFTLYRFDFQTPLEETFLTLSDLIRQGKIHYVGTAEWTAEQLLRAATVAENFQVPLISNQPYYSMLWRVPEPQVMPVAHRAGIGQLAAAPLAHGLLTGKQNSPEGTDPQLLDRIELLRGIADYAGLSMPQLALAWTLQNEHVATAVVGASDPEQVRENVEAAGTTLDLDLLVQIDELLGSTIRTDPRLTLTPSRQDNA